MSMSLDFRTIYPPFAYYTVPLLSAAEENVPITPHREAYVFCLIVEAVFIGGGIDWSFCFYEVHIHVGMWD